MTNEFPAELAGLVGRPPGRAAFLVGESPLPVYAAIALLRPESIMLLYSDPVGRTLGSKRFADSIAGAAERFLDIKRVDCKSIGNPFDVEGVRARIAPLANDFDHLHYTGGTKSMSVGARLAVEPRVARRETVASYLLEAGDRSSLRVDGGGHARLILSPALFPPASFPLDAFPYLHCVPCRAPGTTVMATDALAANDGAAIDRFLAGGRVDGEAVERFVGWQLAQLTGEARLNSYWYTDASRQGYFECDVLATVGHRLVLLSCTSDRDSATARQKLTEALNRGRALGGQYARVGVVAGVSDQTAENLEVIAEAFIRGAPPQVGVFGRSSLANWRAGMRSGLEGWMSA